MNLYVKEDFEFNLGGVLKKQVDQLDNQSAELKISLSNLETRLETLNFCLENTNKQLETLQKEVAQAAEKIKTTNAQISKEVCDEVSAIKNPNTALVDISSKFMQALDQNDIS